MKSLLSTLSLLVCINLANAQLPHAFSSAKSVNIKMIHNGNPKIEFNSWDDYDNGKVVNGYYKVKINCSKPWKISVKATQSNLNSNSGMFIPIQYLSIKPSTDNNFIPLSIAPQTIMTGDPTAADIYIDFDLKLNAPPNIYSGMYIANVDFVIEEL